jgi:hypothetical protein
MLRLRERYALVSLREEQLAQVIADVSGPIRAAAATLLALDGNKVLHPKEALQRLALDLQGNSWDEVLRCLSLAHDDKELRPGEPTETIKGLIELLNAMNKHVQCLR